jgi:hypothetical protein
MKLGSTWGGCNLHRPTLAQASIATDPTKSEGFSLARGKLLATTTASHGFATSASRAQSLL